MQPGGFRCYCACLKARQVTIRQLPRLRLYTRPWCLHRPEQAVRRTRLPRLRHPAGSAGMQPIWPFSPEAIAKRGNRLIICVSQMP